MNFKGFMADHMGHFSIHDLPNAIFMVIMAALLGWALAWLGAGMRRGEARQIALWAATAALGVAFIRMQLPVAIALVAILLLVRPSAGDARQRVVLFGALIAGLGCGSGAALIMAIVMVPYVLIVRWAFARAGDKPDEFQSA